MNKALLSLLLFGLLAACSSTPVKDERAAVVVDKSVTAPPVKTQPEARPAPQASVVGNPLKDPNNILFKRSIYFDFNESTVKDEYRGLVQAHSKYLNEKGSTRVTLQGNTDERGSREYNLALGQRRADSVRKVMNVLGVAEPRMETVSFGEEKPKAPGHDEESWAQNRRVDIIYPGD